MGIKDKIKNAEAKAKDVIASLYEDANPNLANKIKNANNFAAAANMAMENTDLTVNLPSDNLTLNAAIMIAEQIVDTVSYKDIKYNLFNEEVLGTTEKSIDAGGGLSHNFFIGNAGINQNPYNYTTANINPAELILGKTPNLNGGNFDSTINIIAATTPLYTNEVINIGKYQVFGPDAPLANQISMLIPNKYVKFISLTAQKWNECINALSANLANTESLWKYALGCQVPKLLAASCANVINALNGGVDKTVLDTVRLISNIILDMQGISSRWNMGDYWDGGNATDPVDFNQYSLNTSWSKGMLPPWETLVKGGYTDSVIWNGNDGVMENLVILMSKKMATAIASLWNLPAFNTDTFKLKREGDVSIISEICGVPVKIIPTGVTLTKKVIDPNTNLPKVEYGKTFDVNQNIFGAMEDNHIFIYDKRAISFVKFLDGNEISTDVLPASNVTILYKTQQYLPIILPYATGVHVIGSYDEPVLKVNNIGK